MTESDKTEKILAKSKPAGWDKVGKTIPKTRTDVWAWSNKDFAIHVRDLYYAKYNSRLPQSGPGYDSTALKTTRSKFKQRMGGQPDNPTFKGYLDFFFKNYIDSITKKYEVFCMKNLCNDKAIASYCQTFKLTKKLLAVEALETEVVRNDFSAEGVKNTYEAGGTKSVLMTYGIIIAVNHFMYFKKESLDNAIDFVAKKCEECCEQDKNNSSYIVDLTVKYGPYPKWLPFLDCKMVSDRIKKHFKNKRTVSLKIVDDVKEFGFLR